MTAAKYFDSLETLLSTFSISRLQSSMIAHEYYSISYSLLLMPFIHSNNNNLEQSKPLTLTTLTDHFFVISKIFSCPYQRVTVHPIAMRFQRDVQRTKRCRLLYLFSRLHRQSLRRLSSWVCRWHRLSVHVELYTLQMSGPLSRHLWYKRRVQSYQSSSCLHMYSTLQWKSLPILYFDTWNRYEYTLNRSCV